MNAAWSLSRAKGVCTRKAPSVGLQRHGKRVVHRGPSALRAASDDDIEVSQMRHRLDKQYMEGKIEDAVRDAEEVCGEADASTKDCAIAWEEVEELRVASERKNWQAADKNAEREGSSLSGDLDVFGEAPADFETASGDEESFEGKRERGGNLAQARLEINPCDVVECEEPGGTFLAAGELENSLGGGSRREGEGRKATGLKQEIQIAIGEAFDVCGEGDEEECAAAWDKVEDLSYELDKEEGDL